MCLWGHCSPSRFVTTYPQNVRLMEDGYCEAEVRVSWLVCRLQHFILSFCDLRDKKFVLQCIVNAKSAKYTCVSNLKNIVVALKRNYGDVTWLWQLSYVTSRHQTPTIQVAATQPWTWKIPHKMGFKRNSWRCCTTQIILMNYKYCCFYF